MTTIKEYKAMMDGATDALKAVKSTIVDYGDENPEFSLDIEWGNVDVKVKHLEPIKATLEIAPDLIRVLELVEEALSVVWRGDRDNYGFMAEIDCHKMDKINKSLSEIRKLKGE